MDTTVADVCQEKQQSVTFEEIDRDLNPRLSTLEAGFVNTLLPKCLSVMVRIHM